MNAYAIPATISTVESAIYRYDAVFQSQIVPRVYHAGIVIAHVIVHLAIAAVLFGMRCRRWYDAYNAASVAPMIESPMLAIAPGSEPLLLPAETAWHPGRAASEDRAMRQLCKILLVDPSTQLRDHGDALPSLEVLVTPAPKVRTETTGKPAPKTRKPANIAPRKAPARAKVGSKSVSID
jgi:hypothetical protein